MFVVRMSGGGVGNGFDVYRVGGIGMMNSALGDKGHRGHVIKQQVCIGFYEYVQNILYLEKNTILTGICDYYYVCILHKNYSIRE